MIGFVLTLVVFDFAYSLVLGFVVRALARSLVALTSKNDQPIRMVIYLVTSVGVLLCVGQGLIIAAAVSGWLAADPDRWSVVWWIVGLVFSAPLAQVKALGDPEQAEGAIGGILISELAYVVALIFPSVVVEPFAGIGRFLTA